MIVSIQSRIRADVLPQRARKVRKAFVEDTIEVRVRDVAAEDAPVVLAPLDRNGGRNVVRFHDGLLWAVFDTNTMHGGQIGGGMRIARAQFLREAGIDGMEVGSSIGDRSLVANAKIISSQRGLVAPLCQEWAGNHWLKIDGKLHWRTGSPLLSIEDVADAFGKDAAMDLGLIPGAFVPAWFAMPQQDGSLRDHLAAIRPKDAGLAKSILDILDVEIRRPDLFEICRRREASNCLPEEMVKHLGTLVVRNPSPHMSLRNGQLASTQRRKMLKAAACVAYETAAAAGADFHDAMDAAFGAVAMLPSEPRNAEAVLLPAPADAVRIEHPVFFFHQREQDRAAGWSATGTGSFSVGTRPRVLDQDSLGHVATVAGVRYSVDRSGCFHVDPNHIEPGLLVRMRKGIAALEEQGHDLGRRPAGTRTLHNHAQDLAECAKGLTWRGKKQNVDDDHLGRSLRHTGGYRALAGNEDRARTIEEFVFHRMSLVDDRIHLRCPEPLIAVHPDLDKNKVRPWISHSITLLAIPGTRPPFLFRLDQREQAFEIACCRGPWDDGGLENLRLGDPAPLTFDSALWNLRAATKRILDALDGRIMLMDGGTAAAVARLDKSVEAWCIDSSLASSEDAVAELLVDAGKLLAALQSPLMDDIGEDHVRDIARTSLDQALAERRTMEIEPDVEFAGFSM